MDVHQALNWKAMWPLLRALPGEQPLRVLDAGCGDGAWCRRIARRRPAWRVTGLDRSTDAIARGQRLQDRSPHQNLTYIVGDFADGISGQFDLILSVASIHYAASDGRGDAVVATLARALAPGGRLLLLVPRRRVDQPLWPSWPTPHGWPVFTEISIRRHVESAGLRVDHLDGLFGRWCVLSKQIAIWASSSVPRRLAAWPLRVLAPAVAPDLIVPADAASYALRVMATR